MVVLLVQDAVASFVEAWSSLQDQLLTETLFPSLKPTFLDSKEEEPVA